LEQPLLATSLIGHYLRIFERRKTSRPAAVNVTSNHPLIFFSSHAALLTIAQHSDRITALNFSAIRFLAACHYIESRRNRSEEDHIRPGELTEHSS